MTENKKNTMNGYHRKLTRTPKVKVEITPDKYFYSNDGQVFKSLRELSEGIDKMSDETFAYHCNKEKNDFRNWVVDVLDRTRLGRSLKGIKHKEEFKYFLNLYLAYITKPKKNKENPVTIWN